MPSFIIRWIAADGLTFLGTEKIYWQSDAKPGSHMNYLIEPWETLRDVVIILN